MRCLYPIAVVVVLTVGCTPGAKPQPDSARNPGNADDAPSGPHHVVLEQGAEWTSEDRAAFYRQDQGSRLIPLAWLQALKQPDGSPFLADRLSRYGYLANEFEPASSLPIGFSTSGVVGSEMVGMTCAACHTRQIDVGETSYRIDGGPAVADFQSFVADLGVAVKSVVESPDAFEEFARQVLSQPSDRNAVAKLRSDLEAWYLPYHTLMSRSLPADKPWGPARLDALGMIFNRLTGLDIGTGPDHLIPENIQVADAPARYPFLWNASIQDQTQWPGIAKNGNELLALARNLGEVYGVFGRFHPKKAPLIPLLQIDYVKENSADFSGLETLERLIRKIGPPRYPWKIDAELARKGEEIFNRATRGGGCVECHGIQPGELRLPALETWKTPILDVGTDSREYRLLGRKAKSGVLEGASLPFGTPLEENELAATLLKTAVIGAILESPFRRLAAGLEGVPGLEAVAPPTGDPADLTDDMKSDLEQLQGVFTQRPNDPLPGEDASLEATESVAAPAFAYESRVMQGIWAAAPYLHNGSVPTLEALLEPVDRRPVSFMVGPEYDPAAVGLAVRQKKFNFTLHTTDATDRNSGNSRAGHEFGTSLPPEEKRALLEYLKTL